MTEQVHGAAVRAAAAKAIRAVRFDGASLKAVMPKALAGLRDARDRALCEAICFEAVRWMPRYEAVLARLLERPLVAGARDVHGLLLAGLAQLDAMQLADYAALSSSAEAARVLGQPRFVGVVNGVLRRFQREHVALLAAADAEPGVRDAHPPWLVETLQRDWSDASAAILTNNNAAAPLWLRVNLQRGSRDDYLALLRAEGLDADAPDFAPAALRLHSHLAPTRLPGWADGRVSVQDLSAQCVATCSMSNPGSACSTPVLHLAARPRICSNVIPRWVKSSRWIAMRAACSASAKRSRGSGSRPRSRPATPPPRTAGGADASSTASCSMRRAPVPA